jgi:hypothetical protein
VQNKKAKLKAEVAAVEEIKVGGEDAAEEEAEDDPFRTTKKGMSKIFVE